MYVMNWISSCFKFIGLSLVVDYRAMITVESPKYGVFNAKPLKVIWETFKNHYHPGNTIMVCTRPRNFVEVSKKGPI